MVEVGDREAGGADAALIRDEFLDNDTACNPPLLNSPFALVFSFVGLPFLFRLFLALIVPPSLPSAAGVGVVPHRSFSRSANEL